MKLFSKLLVLLRKIYSIPGIKQLLLSMTVSALREAAVRTDNKVDDKIVTALEAALANENYRAVLNGKGKYAKIIAKAEKAEKKKA